MDEHQFEHNESVSLNLKDVLARLSEESRQRFWKFVGQRAKVLKPNRRGMLQNVLHQIDKPNVKNGIAGLPVSRRRISNDDLRRQVIRLKHRLLDHGDALPWVTDVFCSWVQETELDLLLLILDGLDCPHDSQGNNKGSIPNFSADKACDIIFTLAEHYPLESILKVCGGLIINDERWSGLLKPFDEAPAYINSQQYKEVRSEMQEVEVGVEANIPPKPNHSDLADIQSSMADLEKHLDSAVEMTQQSRIPDLDDAIACWEALRGKFQNFSKSLNVVTDNVKVLEAALHQYLANADLMPLIEKASKVVHGADPNFDLSPLSNVCDVLQRDPSQTFNLAKGLKALILLVEGGEKLPEETADALSEEVENLLGRKIAVAALRRNLIISQVDSGGGEGKSEKNRVNVIVQTEKSSLNSSQDSLGQTSELKNDKRDDDVSVNVLDIHPEYSPIGTTSPNGVEAEDFSVTLSVDRSLELFPTQEVDDECKFDIYKEDHNSGNDNHYYDAFNKYVTFKEFREEFWINASGEVSRAPWACNGFAEKLGVQVKLAWEEGFLAEAVVFANAQRQLGHTPYLNIEELTVANRLILDPDNAAIGIDRNRADTLRVGASQDKILPDFAVSVMLESLRPTLPCSLDVQDIESIISAAKFNDVAIADVAEYLLKAWASNINPFDIIRSRLDDDTTTDPIKLEKLVRISQEKLRHEINSAWQAAGGKILRKHCKKAWSEFIQLEVAPLREELAPKGSADNVKRLNPSQVQQRAAKLIKGYKRIMDAGEVKYDDRVAADHSLEQIINALLHLQENVQRMQNSLRDSRIVFDGCPHEKIVRLISDENHKGSEKLCVYLLRAALKGPILSSPLQIDVAQILAEPNLLRCLSPNIFEGSTFSSNQINPNDICDYVVASALLKSYQNRELPEQISPEDVINNLHDVALNLERMDLLAALSPTDLLQSHERTLLYSYALRLGDEVFEQFRHLEKLWGILEELLVMSSATLKKCVEEASVIAQQKLLDGSTVFETQSITNTLLAKKWLSLMIPLASNECELAKKSRIDLAKEHSEEMAEKVIGFFDVENYRGVTMLLNGSDFSDSAATLPARRTMWRQDAIERFTNPRETLEREFKNKVEEQRRLIDLWLTPKADLGAKENIERLFYAVISGESGRTIAENQRRFHSLTELRDHSRARKTVINCIAIREYFRRTKLNPSFLPQLAEFSQIVITTSPIMTTRSLTMLDDWARVVDAEASQALLVFLAPGISDVRRNDLTSGMRKRGIAAAVIDDIDLCRLCEVNRHTEGHDFIPFLEIVLEQLDLDAISPFSSQDGQHVRVETYVGRSQEARQVVFLGNYTRVFSGRKLGKSALLKYIATTFDQESLPSGNKLHIFFITIAGGESESWLVRWIIDEMSSRFDFHEDKSFSDQAPAERFSNFMQRFINEHPRISVLIILDEADAFIEGQLARYDQDRESSLSFRMMKELPTKVDSHDFPRIRVIFSGYRVTNTRGAVWANAGDVLVLRPLTELEAVQFLRGMLARVGVDIGDHGPSIARRCGFQPAVLIRFGDSLLKRLKRAHHSVHRESLRVTEEEVRATLHEQAVMDEIRTVVNNNFQGNRVGAVIFGATLLALKDLEPGLALRAGPAQVLEKLREIDPNIDWLEKIDISPVLEIERNLHDFIERGLLTVSNSRRIGVREYRLRFPHFLPVLTQQSEVALEVRQQIQTIRAGSLHRRLSESIIAESVLDSVRYWYQELNVELCKIVVVAGPWAAALEDEKRGIPDRLGLDRNAVAKSATADEIMPLIADGFRVFSGVPGNLLSTYVRQANTRPIILLGGLELLREARQHVLTGEDTPIEIATIGRLPEATLTWWFERARALHFESPVSIQLIAEKTEGIPFLVSWIDRLLDVSDGEDVSDDKLKKAFAEFDNAMPQIVRKLTVSESDYLMTSREVELLCMLVRFAKEIATEFDLEDEFAATWISIFGEKDEMVAPMSDETDRLALEIICDSGLIQRIPAEVGGRASALGRVRVTSDGIASKVVAFIEAVNGN